jgi:CHAD domain-containing protein
MIGPLARRRLGDAARLVAGVKPSSSAGRIHDLRVALRRAQPFIEISRPDIPTAAKRRWLSDARRGERLFGSVRNCDVAAKLVLEFKKIDREAVRHLRHRLLRRRKRRLAEALSKYYASQRLAWARRTYSFSELLVAGLDGEKFPARLEAEKGKRLRAAGRAAARLSPASPAERWHALRKELRLFRYAIDDQAALGRAPDRREKKVLSLQLNLGDANDLAMLGRRVERARVKLPRGSALELGCRKLESAIERRRSRLLSASLAELKRVL